MPGEHQPRIDVPSGSGAGLHRVPPPAVAGQTAEPVAIAGAAARAN